MRRGFTLTELMIVITIMAIMGGLGLAAMSSAVNLAREHRTVMMIKKIDALIMERWEGYRTRSLAIRIPPGVDSRTTARIRLNAMRELQRMEVPDRVTDIIDGPQNVAANEQYQNGQALPPVMLAQPSLQKSYQRRLTALCGPAWSGVWTTQYQGSECLYLILSTMRDNDKSALDYFDTAEISDNDGDGVPEILDGWGTPIEFLRWAPGYISTPAVFVDTIQVADRVAAPDPFDPAKADIRWSQPATLAPYLLHPLIVSSGRDKDLDIAMRVAVNGNSQFHYVTTSPIDDPYYVPAPVAGLPQFPIGTPIDENNNGPGWLDNITNHGRQ